MKQINVKNVHSFCRTCLNELGSSNVLAEEKFNIHETMISQWVTDCISLIAKKNDKFPKFLCHQCYEKLQYFNDFRAMSHRSMRILEGLLNESASPMKSTEDVSRVESGEEEEVLNEIYGNRDWLEFDYEITKPVASQSKGNDDSTRPSTEEVDDKNLVITKFCEPEELLVESNDYKKERDSETEMDEQLNETKFEFNDNIEIGTLQYEQNDILEELEREEDTAAASNSEGSVGGEIDYKVDKEGDEVNNSTDDSSDDDMPLIQRVKSKRTIKCDAFNVKPRTRKASSSIKSKPAPITKEKKFELKFQCELCPRRCISQENLSAHMRTHQGLKPFQCTVCDRSFNKASHMRVHLREVHTEHNDEIVCSYEGCGKVFRRDATYKVHYRIKHSDSKPVWKSYMCEDCGRTFKNITTLREHRYKHSPEEEYPFQCERCGKRYISQRTYKEHLMRHAGIKNFQCPYCGMKKTTRNELRTHINYHTKEKQWPCKMCSSIFNSSANLGMHVRVVHKGIRKFTCRYCDQSFGKPDTLKHHEMRHTGEKPHECKLCNKRFIQIVALRAHMKTHNKSVGKQSSIEAFVAGIDPQAEQPFIV